MINFISLEFKNFQSYGNKFTKFEFDGEGTNLIKGANGAGKSSLISGLVYGCFGKSVEGLKDNELINNINGKEMEVIVIFKKGDTYYRVHRGRKVKSQDFVRYWENFDNNFHVNDKKFNENHEKTLDSMANTNKIIERIIGISYELFIRIIVFSANHKPFFELSARTGQSNQCDLIEELFDLDELAINATNLKNSLKDTEVGLKIELNTADLKKAEKERYERQLEQANERIEKWEKDTKNNIFNLQAALDKVKDISLDDERESLDEKNRLTSEITEIDRMLSTIGRNLKRTKDVKETLESDLVQLHSAKCPYCKQQFHSVNKIGECEDGIKKNQIEIDTISKELDEKTKEVNDLKFKLEMVNECITIDNIDELLAIKNKQEMIMEKIRELTTSSNPHHESLKDLQDNKVDKHDMTAINELTKRKEHQKFLYKLLTDKNSFVRKALLNKHIPYLNSRLYTYCQDMDLPHTVEFGHDLSAKITKYSKELHFKNLSNGQRARVNLALSLSFRDILQKMYGRINICVLDEVLDAGLDATGVELATKLLKRKTIEENMCLYVITHRANYDNYFDNIIKIDMVNNFSEIG